MTVNRMSARNLIAASVAMAIFAALAVTIMRSGSDGASPARGQVKVVPGAASVLTTPPSVGRPSPAIAARDPDQLAEAILARFPTIREVDIVCEDGCKLIAALGDQGAGLSPYGGNLERFLAAQGYKLEGELVVDQPGDNDTLLTIGVALPANSDVRQRYHAAVPG